MKQMPVTTTINGIRVVYYKFGNGAPLLFLHGGRVRAQTFKRLLGLLADKYTIIAPDIPGFGVSDTPPSAWSFIEYAHFFDRFLTQLKISHVTVIGYSMGGGIAANLASISGHVTKLVLIDSSAIRRNGKQNHHDMRRLWFYITHPFLVRSLAVLTRDYLQYVAKHRHNWKQMRKIRRACFHTSYDNMLRNITVPTQLLWGDADWIYPIEIAHAFQEFIPHATLKTVSGNHDWPIYNPALIKVSSLL